MTSEHPIASPLKRGAAAFDGAPRGKRLQGELQGDATQPQRTLGAPRAHARLGRYETAGGVLVDCNSSGVEDPNAALEALIDKLESHRGCLF